MEFPYLSTILFLPALGAVAVALWPGVSHRTINRISFFFTALPLLLSLYLFLQFDRQGGFQFQERYDWIKAINAFYYLGVDGLSLPMVLLTTTLGFLAVLVSWKIELRPREYFAWLLLLETGILGVFMSMDLLLFFLFWEVELIPMYMLITIWGSGRKEYSAIKFVVYTLFGSALMLAGIGGDGIVPGVANDYAQIIVAFAVVSVLYGAAVTLRQTDLKRLIAYSS